MEPMAAGSRVLEQLKVTKMEQLVAITTPNPGPDGQVSRKTPVFHLPVYKIRLIFENDPNELELHCDLADLTDLIDKLKRVQNQWLLSGRTGNRQL